MASPEVAGDPSLESLDSSNRPVLATVLGMAVRLEKVHCIRCGKSFGREAGEKVVRCPKCLGAATARRKVFDRLYHRARSRAIARTIDAHREDFDRFMDEELEKVGKEGDAVEFARAARAKLNVG
jgi:hypothetical protein